MRLLFSFLLFTFSFASTAQIPSYVPTNGLVGWWPFNGNANDESGNGNNGVVNGATLTSDRFGNANGSYYFNGANSNFIEIPSSPSLNTTNASFTWSFWIKYNSISSDGWYSNPGIISKTQNGTTCNGATLIEGGGRIGAQNLMNCGTNLINNGVGTIQITADNIWHHVVMTLRNGDSTKTYIDGVFQQSNYVDITFSVYSNTPVRIGRPTDPYWKSFTGNIDDIAIYNRALSQAEIIQLYTGTVTPTTPEDTTSNVGIGTTTPKRKLHVNDVMRLEPRSSAPANPGEGDIYYDATIKKLRYYNGTSWISL